MNAPRTPWSVQAAPRFNKRRKKLTDAVQRETNKVVADILQDPRKGDPKTGDLRGIHVEKFKVDNDQFLLAYRLNEKTRTVEVIDIGQHENFYRDLSKYLKERPKE
jgi:mRNA-degrading endonuclease RelE of RelBE toxin-antitoxin system